MDPRPSPILALAPKAMMFRRESSPNMPILLCLRPNLPATRSQGALTDAARPLLGLSVLVVLLNERPEIVDLFLVLDTGERHLGAGNLRLRVLDVVLELSLVPGDAGILVGVRIGIIRRGTGLAAVQSVELWAHLAPGACADRVAGHAFVERRLAGRDILRQRRGCGGRRCDNNQCAQRQFFQGVLFVVSGVSSAAVCCTGRWPVGDLLF